MGMDGASTDWRSQLQPDSRQRIVNKISIFHLFFTRSVQLSDLSIAVPPGRPRPSPPCPPVVRRAPRSSAAPPRLPHLFSHGRPPPPRPSALLMLRELEKLGPKRGVISQSVKDVVQSLVDDDLVLKDKIGSSIYFWSLPSCAGNQLRNAYIKLESDLASSKKRLADLVEQRDSLKNGREESDEREAALDELKTVELQHKELKEQLSCYADNDPATIEAMKSAIEVAHSAANRWTDDIFTLQHWCSTTFPEAKEQLEHMYKEAGVTEDFEYLQ